MDEPIWTEPEVLGPRCPVARPRGSGDGLRILYLLHGIRDTETDWWSGKGQLGGILADVRACPMLIVMPFNGLDDKTEPKLDAIEDRFLCARKLVAERFKPDEIRQGIMGISIGAKQALAIFLEQLNEKGKAGFDVLGLISGMFQGKHLEEVKAYAGAWP